jgi:urease accessory protein
VKTHFRRLLVVALAATFMSLAHAHPGHDGHDLTWDFRSGFLHPLTGWDHLIAMIAVGWWAAQLGGRARWVVPAAFVGLMALSAALGKAAVPMAATDQIVAASVVVLGLLLAVSARLPLTMAAAIVGAFAVFHGLAHGAEMPVSDLGSRYWLGLIAATATLHVVGLIIGVMATHASSRTTRFAGYTVALAGLLLLAG